MKGAVAFLVMWNLEKTVRVNITRRESDDASTEERGGGDDALGLYGVVARGAIWAKKRPRE